MNKEIPKSCLLYEYLRANDFGDDMGDTVWDIIIYFDCAKDWESCDSGYDRFCLLLALNINVDEHGCANFSEFMWNNRDVFDKFFEENNREGYRPSDYEKLDPKCDSGFYEVYMLTLKSLLDGNYCDDDYDLLYSELSAKD